MTPQPLPRRVGLLFPVAALAAAGLLAVAQWPSYWVWIAPEQTPMGFVQALFLFSAALFAGLLALVSRLEATPREERIVWSLAALGFFYLMADERFALHERLRDNVLVNVDLALPWGSPGDYVLVLFLFASLAILPRLLLLLRAHGSAIWFFAAGVALTVLVVAADTVDVRSLSLRVERLEQTIEEVVEAVAASLLAAGLFLAVSARLTRLADRAARARQLSPEPVATGPKRAREDDRRRTKTAS